MADMGWQRYVDSLEPDDDEIIEEILGESDKWQARAEAAEAQLAEARDYVDFALGDANPDAPDAPLVDRIVRLVSVLAASSVTMPGLDAVVKPVTVDTLARRVDALERFATATAGAIATQLEGEERYRLQLDALELIVSDLQRLAAETHN